MVATPIGNLGDLTPRAAEALATADLVLCEDTRHTARLLQHLGLRKTCWSLHAHNETQQVPGVLQRLAEGAQVAMVSDAGTPCLSDPGARLVAAVHDAGHRVESVPGPFAAAVALASSGLTPIPFAFWGFLPKKQGERHARLRETLKCAPGREPMTHAFYAPGRDLRDVVEDLQAIVPRALAVMSRELTKVHEGHLRGTPAEILSLLRDEMLRGEAVVLVEVGPDTEADAAAAVQDPAALVQAARAAGRNRKEALKAIGQATGVSRRVLYGLWLAEGGADEAGGESTEGQVLPLSPFERGKTPKIAQ